MASTAQRSSACAPCSTRSIADSGLIMSAKVGLMTFSKKAQA